MKDTTCTSNAKLPQESHWFSVNSLRSYLERVRDPRKKRGIRYRLVDLLTLLILAKLGGEDKMKGIAEWVRLREATLIPLLGIKRKCLPHQTTYERVLDRLDEAELETLIGAFFAAQSPQEGQMIVLDGKTLRGTIPHGSTQGVHLLAAYAPQQGVVLMQVEVADKANELTMAPHMLDKLELTHTVVTGDALFTQRSLCEQIVSAEGDYVFPVKDNQPRLRQAIADLFMPAPVSAGHGSFPTPDTCAQTVACGHGRIEQRLLTVSSQLNEYLDWPHVGQVFRLQRLVQHQKTGQLTYQVVFGITSYSAAHCAPEHLMALVRQHWHIENRLHYVRDVTFREDACLIRQPKRQRMLACLNNLVIGLLRQTDFNYIPEARRFFNLHFDQAFSLLC